MTIAKHTTLPIFQADQVLTSDHLNELVSYLEEQERLTRAKLIGTGIACGLQIRTIGNEIAIRTGVGVSSTGLLFAFAGDNNGETRYGFHRPLLEETKKAYSFFRKGDSTRDIFELLPQKLEGADALPDDLSEFGVLLYMECYDRKLKNCVQNDCNEKGWEREFRLRPLLVSLTDLREIICEEEDLNVPKSEADIAERFYGAYTLPHLQLQRFRPGHHNLLNYQDLYDYYQTLISNSLPDIMKGLKASYSKMAPVLISSYGSAAAFTDAISVMSDRFNQIRLNQPVLLQYFHAFLCDMVEAYHEYRDCAFDLLSACCPPLQRFPKHLRLGQLVGPEGCGPSAYRTVFQHAELYNQRGLRDKVIALHRRMYTMLLRFTDPRNFSEQRITPSVGLDRLLSQKTIPYYYRIDQSLLRRWNPMRTARCRTTEQLSYHAKEYAADQPYTVEPLRYQLRPYDFYRIEGHLGMLYTQALERILSLRNQNNLAFDVMALKLGRSADSTSIADMKCSFQDLEIICNAWKEDLACRLRNVAQNLGQVNVAGSLKANAGTTPSLSNTTATNTGSLSFNRTHLASSLHATHFTGATTMDLSGGAFAQNKISLKNNPATSYIKVGQMVRNSIPVSQEADLLGNYIVQGIEKAPVHADASTYAAIALEELRKRDDLAQLKNKDFQLAYELPVKIVATAYEFAKRAEVSCDNIDIQSLDQTQTRLQQLFAAYLALLIAYDNDNEDAEVIVNTMATIQLANLFLSYCSLEKLKILITEMERRKEELRQLNLFHNYLRKHPGMDHAGGVPKGGTFVLVYHEEDRISNDDDPSRTIVVSGQVVDNEGNVLLGATVLAVGTASGTITDFDGRFTLTVPASTQFLDITRVGLGRRRVLITGPTTSLSVQLDGSDNVGQNDRPTPANRTVVADFFLPYNCCSDCPPIDYVLLPPEPDTAVSLQIERDLFCVPTEATGIPFTVEPADGVVSGEGVSQNADGIFVFNPNDVDLADLPIKQITFQVNDQPVPLVITIERSPQAACEFFLEWQALDGVTQLVATLQNFSSENAEIFTWRIIHVDANGGEIATVYKEETESRNPIKTPIVAKPEDLLQVELTARSANCSDTKTGDPIPVPSPEVAFRFRVVDKAGSPMDHTQIPITFVSDLFLLIEPGEGTLGKPSVINKLGLEELSVSPTLNQYHFKPLDKPAEPYPFTYKLPNGNKEEFTLTLIEKNDGLRGANDFQTKLNTNRALLTALGNDSVFSEHVGTNAKTLTESKKTYDQMAVLAKTARGRAKMGTDAFAKTYAVSIGQATEDTSKRWIATADMSNTSDQQQLSNQLGRLYQAQIMQTLQYIDLLDKDLPRTHDLSKLLTNYTKQLTNLAKKEIVIDSDGTFVQKLEKTLQQWSDRPGLAAKVEKMVAVIKS